MNSVKTAVYEPIENYFDQFCAATTYEGISFAFERLCDAGNLRCLPGNGHFYRELRQRLSFYWKAEALFTNLDVRFNGVTYKGQTACENVQVLVVGFGPCGLRSAIELALLGANVVVIDKRISFSRNNVLHLWPYLINDLKSLGAKSFFSKFCAGSIDHISIRTLQCILLKAALLFGVQIVSGVEFQRLIQPSDGDDETIEGRRLVVGGNERPLRKLFTLHTGERARHGWRVEVKPHHETLSTFEFDAIVDATGKSNSCLNFPRKALRCRLAIAITVNFVNYHDVEEVHVEEISGVASIFNQSYFAQISKTLGIDLENLVYYKDETHYFVMTIKKKSLLAKGILMEDLDDPVKLLSSDNVNNTAVQQLAREVATFATRGGLKRLDFALNEQGQPDVAVFDFTSLSAAQYACCVVDRQGRPLCQCLVGDALLEPFWPRGSGCALGFLSALDAAWAVSLFAAGHHALRVVAWRDSIYQRLSQTSPSNMPPNYAAYSLLPTTRYTYADLELVRPMQVRHLYDSDVLASMTERQSFAFLRDSIKSEDTDTNPTTSNGSLDCSSNRYTPQISLLKWYQLRLSPYPTSICPPIFDLSAETWSDGRALRCVLHKYRPDLVAERAEVPIGLDETMRLFSEYFGAPPGLASIDWPKYLTALHDCLITLDPAFVANMAASSVGSIHSPSRRIDPFPSPHLSSTSNKQPLLSPHLEYRRVDVGKIKSNLENPDSPVGPPATAHSARQEASDAVEKGLMSKRRSELIAMLNDPASAKRRNLLIEWEKAFEDARLPPPPSPPKIFQYPPLRDKLSNLGSCKEKSRDLCVVCKEPLYAAESRAYDRFRLHPRCFRCAECQRPLRPDVAHCQYHPVDPKFYCTTHFHPFSEVAPKKVSSSGSSKMSARTPGIPPKARAPNSPSLFYDLRNPVSASRRPQRGAATSATADTSSNVLSLTSDITSDIQPSARSHNNRRWSVLRGIRDEPAPPVLLNAHSGVPGTLGLPECTRRAAFDERLYLLNGSTSADGFLSDNTSMILGNEDFFASSEEERSDLDVTSNITSSRSESPPISVDEATQLCRVRRDESSFLRQCPLFESSSSSDDSESDEDSRISTVGTFDTPQPVPEYANARWTLLLPHSPDSTTAPTSTIINTSIPVESSPLVQKYGLSGHLLLAKQRFCMADPEPIRIDSKAFRAMKNKERTTENILPDCTEVLERISTSTPIFLPLINDIAHPSTLIDCSTPSELFTVIPRVCSSTHLHLPIHTLPLESMVSIPPLPHPKTDTLASSIVSESVYMTFDRGSTSKTELLRLSRNDTITTEDIQPNRTYSPLNCFSAALSERVSNKSRLWTGNLDESTVVSNCDHVLEASPVGGAIDVDPYSVQTLASTSSDDEDDEESDEGMEFLQRTLIVPPTELSQKVKKNIDQNSRHNCVPLYMLTSKLDSDDDQRSMDPQDVLNSADEEEDTSETSSDEEAHLPPISDIHAKEIVALKNRLTQLEKEMRKLEIQGAEKERVLRELEESANQQPEVASQASSTSEPDLTVNSSSKREPSSHWHWMLPKRSAGRTTSNSTVAHQEPEREMSERPDRAQLFSELLNLISQRNKLVTQEAVIMAELKKIELDAYEERLRKTYDALKQDGESVPASRVKIGAFKRHGARRFKKERIYPANRDPGRQDREKMLLDEIWKISKEKTALTAVQGETMRRSNLQELSIRKVLNRGGAVFHRVFSRPAFSTTTPPAKKGTSGGGESGGNRRHRYGIRGN